ncbi:MAG: glycosyltransferase [Prevotellaceae bacterium]|jgi:glycosyltransferase involved in cell wall biosynthesis|nr:glycosyltransferase [Prevotellaceae bacterium]
MKEGGKRLKGLTKNNDKGDLLTMITVVFNGVNTIEDTIRSVVEQDYPNLEYIVIDGGSTDGTLDIVRCYEDHIDYWISAPDKGIADAFNKGIQLAQGEVIGLINADDYLMPGTAASVMKLHDRQAPKIICGAILLIHPHRPLRRWESTLQGFEREMTIAHPATYMPAAFYRQWGLFDVQYKIAMDYELLYRMRSGGAPFLLSKDVWATMRSGGASSDYWKALTEIVRCQRCYKPAFSPLKSRLFMALRYLQFSAMRLSNNLHIGYWVGLRCKRKIFKNEN